MNQDIENSEHINKIIAEAFDLVRQIYEYRNTPNLSIGTRLVFPKNRYNDVRISEQELRFAFVEVFNRYVANNGLNWFYSVEMPTRKEHGFSGNGQRNALFDLSILDAEYHRIALIEFKAKNPDRKCYQKDIKKLSNPAEDDGSTLKYFLQIVENHDGGTVKSIENKTKVIQEDVCGEDSQIHIRTYSLSKGEEIINKTIV